MTREQVEQSIARELGPDESLAPQQPGGSAPGSQLIAEARQTKGDR